MGGLASPTGSVGVLYQLLLCWNVVYRMHCTYRQAHRWVLGQ